jgi:hypothetical protein
MSLNSIKFEPTDIALLFKNSLVEINSSNQVLSKTDTKPGWKYLGENKKKALVVVRYPDIVHIPDKQLLFLTKLLAACNLSLGDVAILNFHHYQSSDFDNLLSYFNSRVVLLFDIEPGEFGMPMKFPQFQVQGYKNIAFVSSPSLDAIEPDKVLKSKLWVCLKKIFSL